MNINSDEEEQEDEDGKRNDIFIFFFFSFRIRTLFLNHFLAISAKQKKIRTLENVDHSKIQYAPFKRDFYIEGNQQSSSHSPLNTYANIPIYLPFFFFFSQVPEIARMTDEEVATYRKTQLEDVKIRGKGSCPKPIKYFTQAGLNDKILAVMKKYKYLKLLMITSSSVSFCSFFPLPSLSYSASPFFLSSFFFLLLLFGLHCFFFFA